MANNEELNKVLLNISRIKCPPLQDYQLLQLHIHKARQDVVNLKKRLCHARKDLEEEKRKRRIMENHKNSLEYQIHIVREVLFHDKRINLCDEIKEKLKFLNRSTAEVRRNNLYVQSKKNDKHLSTIAETDSTGSILSDLNCLSKSEDDLETEAIMRAHKYKEWKKYEPINEYSATNKQCSTLDKVAEFNLSNRVTSTIAKSNIDKCSILCENKFTLNKENSNSNLINTEVAKNHNFISKIVIRPSLCVVCDKRIKFGKTGLRCKLCKMSLHIECKIQTIPLCVPESEYYGMNL
ncbi:rac GTPase-activating protein 1-like [Linepithema humile]|uniref:rac GTPase-activating protein 1-like n=1 Tax=Linepithema humile TaxID=83485 RepID=UPI00351F10E6